MANAHRNFLSTPSSSTTLFLKYHAAAKVLEIGFTTKEIYEYKNVPLSIWNKYREAILAGASSGSFFNRYIKDKYSFTKIT